MPNIRKYIIPSIILVIPALLIINTISTNKKFSSDKIYAPEGISPKKTLINKYKWIRETATSNDMRKFPYPYKAMLAICSDIDDTTLKEFETYHQYLNTNTDTPYGKGLGLDIGDSFWIFMRNKSTMVTDATGGNINDVMSFCQGLNDGKLHDGYKIIKYIKCGWIDTFHTFGDFSDSPKNTLCTRNYAIKAWNVMNKYNIHPSIWINHGTPTNKQNFGAYKISPFYHYQAGDITGSKYYHTDISIKKGIHYLWDSEASNVFGVDYPMYILKTSDGQKLWGFHRYTSEYAYIKGIGNHKIKPHIEWLWDTPTFYEEINTAHLDKLINYHQYSIVAQHLGLGNKDLFPFNDLIIRQLKLLASYQNQKKILIARTSRLLNYALSQRYINYKISYSRNNKYISIININDPIFGSKIPNVDDLRGLTFYSSYPQNTHIMINNKEIPLTQLLINPPDETGEKSISIRWFKSDMKNYAPNSQN